jgi:hypothetical protein
MPRLFHNYSNKLQLSWLVATHYQSLYLESRFTLLRSQKSRNNSSVKLLNVFCTILYLIHVAVLLYSHHYFLFILFSSMDKDNSEVDLNPLTLK